MSASDGSFELCCFSLGYEKELYAQKEGMVVVEPGILKIDSLNPEPVTLVMMPECRIEGLVVSRQGEPLADQQIAARRMNVNHFDPYTAFSGLDGRFSIAPLLCGIYELGVYNMMQMEPLYITQVELKPTNRTRDLRIELDIEPEKRWTVFGKVINELGKPVGNIKVMIVDKVTRRDGNHFEFFEAITNNKGEYKIENIREGHRAPYVSAYEYEGIAESVPVTKDTEINIVALRLGSIVGQVTDAQTGKPVEEFKIRLYPQNKEQTFWTKEGYFTFESAGLGDSTLYVEVPGYCEGRIDVTIPTTEPIKILLSPAGIIEGVVVNAMGQGIANAVIYEGEHGGAPLGENVQLLTDEEGRFSIQNWENWGDWEYGAVDLVVFKAPYAAHRQKVPLVKGETTKITIVLEHGGTIAGRVLAGDTPLPGYTVEAISDEPEYRLSTRSDTKGYYEIAGMPQGEVKVGAAKINSGSLMFRQSRSSFKKSREILEIPVDIRADTTTYLDIQFAPEGAVEGYVNIENFNCERSKVTIWVQPPDERFITRSTHLTEAGYYYLGNLPAGRASCCLTFIPENSVPIVRTRSLEIVPGRTVRQDFDLSRGANLKVTVLNEEEIMHSSISLYEGDREDKLVNSGITTVFRQGDSFIYNNLQEGKVTLSYVCTPGEVNDHLYIFKTIEVTAGENIELVLDANEAEEYNF